jgi:alpha-1,6-mannosyltransferase
MPGGDASRRDRVVLVAAAAVLVGAFAGLGAVDDLHRHIPLFFSLYAVAFVAYIAGVRIAFRSAPGDRVVAIAMVAAAVLARVVALPAHPDLSSDIYRYVWEGRMVLHGVNPFVVAPADTALAPLRDADYALINHKHLATIYPPLAQALFALTAKFRADVHAFKAMFVVFDLATLGALIALLRARGRPAAHALVYAWSPLVIFETAHSGHLDAAGVFLLVAGLALAARRQRVGAFVAFAASILVKYMAIALLPFFVAKRRWLGIAIVVAVVVAGYLPFVGAGGHLVRSLREYGNAWWFNGPPFMALSGVVRNPELGRGLLTAFGAAFAVAVGFRERDLVRAAFLIIACALLLSPTVYPWYVVWIVPFLCIFPSRAWLAFTGLVALSYAVWTVYNRSGMWMIPNSWLALEYVPFYVLLAWEGTRRRPAVARG